MLELPFRLRNPRAFIAVTNLHSKILDVPPPVQFSSFSGSFRQILAK